MKVAILGAGMVGSAIAIDLSKKFTVSSFDINQTNLDTLKQHPSITRIKTDLSLYNGYPALLSGFDLVVSAVPGFMGYNTLKTIIEAGKDVVDISFFPENALDLDETAKKHHVTAIVDCGVAPGMSNLILGYHDAQMQVFSFECMVGGLPKKRIKPFEYKAPFSPVDVIEEYTRPARYIENGHIVTKPAMSDTELIDFEHAGTLESFNTDGLRSILFTMSHIPDMKEKTLRYPGHIDLMKALLKAGFFSHEEMVFNDKKIRPIDFTSALLFDKWKLQPEEEEFTIMKIIITGKKDGEGQRVSYLLYDEYDAATKTSSMSRTTGYTCTAAINLLADKLFTRKGVFPPEIVGKEKACFDYIIKYLAERNIIYKATYS
jgi:saccharopine dehydrogenase-like NADP-dependent oxidoreductase